MLRCIMLLLIMVLFYAVPSALCAEPGSSLQAHYAAMKSFTASFEQVLVHKESGMKETRSGKLIFSKPLLIRWETKDASGNSELLVVNSKEIWNYLPEESLAYRMPLDLVQDSRTIIQVITGQANLDKDFDVKEKGAENGLLRLLLYPKEPLPQMVEARLWVDPNTNLIRRAVIIDFYGNSNDITLSDLRENISVASSAFSFTPPKGVDVEDRMDPNIQERTLFQ